MQKNVNLLAPYNFHVVQKNLVFIHGVSTYIYVVYIVPGKKSASFMGFKRCKAAKYDVKLPKSMEKMNGKNR